MTVIISSSKINYNIIGNLLQVDFAKGGIIMYIFRAYITTKDGTKIYAKDYGKKAFRIWVGPEKEPVKKK